MLAALLGALSLFHAAPAAAQTTATLSASPTTVTEGQTVTFTVSLTSAATQISGFDPPFSYDVRRITSEFDDHGDSHIITNPFRNAFFFPAGQTSHTFEIATSHETTEDQEDETFSVTLVNPPTGYTVGSPSSVTITILDDDKPSVSLSASPNPVQEGSPVTVTASLSHATVNALTIPVTLTAGTAESGDYGTLTSISIAAGATSGTGTVTTVKDADSDGETFTAALGTTLPSTVTRGSPDSVEVTISDKITVTLGPASLSVKEGKKAVLKLGFSGCENNNYVGIPVITTQVDSESGWRLSRGVSGPGGSPDVLSYGPDHDFGLGNPHQPHTLTPPTHSCGSGDVYIDTYRDCDTDHETFTVELDGDTMRWPDGYGRGSQYKVTVTIIDDGGQEFCTRTPPPARQPADQPPPNTEETDTDDGTPATPANTGGSGGGGGTSGGLSGPPAGGGGGGGGGLPPSGNSDEPPPEDDELSTLCSQEDRETLGNFYETTGGENWDENENWNSPEPPQEWFGVETDEDGNVVSLRLSHNALSGEVPARELLCLSELKELALWGNEEDLSGEVPEELVLRVERAVLRDIAEMLDLNPGWFENYGDPYNFEDWHEGVTTDDDGRVTELVLTGAEIPESVSELKRLREIMITSSGGGGCAMGASQGRMGASALLVAILMLLALSRGLRARRD